MEQLNHPVIVERNALEPVITFYVEPNNTSSEILELAKIPKAIYPNVVVIINGTALVNDGRMYLTTANSHLMVVDPMTGAELWRYDHNFEDVDLCCGPHNRGVALYEDMVFYGTLDAHLMAFDAATGTQLWDTEVGDNRESLSITGAPLVVKDIVLIGVGGGEFGIRGFIDADDVHTGELRWRVWTTAGEDDPNNDTWLGESWKTCGGPKWVTGNYDP